MLPIDALTFRQAYNGVANATLWFLLHMLYEAARSPVFDQAWRRSWAGYQRYNRAFAEAIAAEAAHGATVMIQDYHLFLAPRLLRDLRPDVRIGHFTHTPWVPAEYFHMLPGDVARDVLDGVSAADVVGFHCARWRDQFVDCCRSILGRAPASRVGSCFRFRPRRTSCFSGPIAAMSTAPCGSCGCGGRSQGHRTGGSDRAVQERVPRAAGLPGTAALARRVA